MIREGFWVRWKASLTQPDHKLGNVWNVLQKSTNGLTYSAVLLVN